MRRSLTGFAALVALTLLLASNGWAKKQQLQDINFGAITCQEFIADIATASEDDAGVVIMWLDGYLSGVSGDTVLNWGTLESFTEKLLTTCAKSPNKKILDVAKSVGIQ